MGQARWQRCRVRFVDRVLAAQRCERAPYVAWVRKTRWNALSEAQRRKFPPLCPDFVIELRSASDALALQQAKLEEYLACGACLGWLIDADERQVYVYRPGHPMETLHHAAELRGDPELPGLVLDLRSIW